MFVWQGWFEMETPMGWCIPFPQAQAHPSLPFEPRAQQSISDLAKQVSAPRLSSCAPLPCTHFDRWPSASQCSTIFQFPVRAEVREGSWSMCRRLPGVQQHSVSPADAWLSPKPRRRPWDPKHSASAHSCSAWVCQQKQSLSTLLADTHIWRSNRPLTMISWWWNMWTGAALSVVKVSIPKMCVTFDFWFFSIQTSFNPTLCCQTYYFIVCTTGSDYP